MTVSFFEELRFEYGMVPKRYLTIIISVRSIIKPFAKHLLHFRTRKNLRDPLVPTHHFPVEKTGLKTLAQNQWCSEDKFVSITLGLT